MSRYVVGIDLGTTNSALAYADSTKAVADGPGPVERLPIPQVVALNDVSERPLLPSFLYLAAPKEFPAGALDLPWKSPRDRVVGSFARDHGAKVPGRLVGSAKSWLSHQGVDRRSPILPWSAPDDVARISPVDASSAFLEHLRDAWNARIPGKAAAERLENQEVFLTVPASFDPVARELTIEAATKAGLKTVTLLEEPQAAFYAWLAHQGQNWRKQVKAGDIILVCDVGGGTTDFTLIAVKDEGGDLVLSRLAVGEHILLGGDNMDLALAYAVAATLPKGMEGLDAAQRIGLLYACRGAKETLFSEPKKNAAPVNVLGRGSKVVGGSIKTELTRDVLKTVLAGWFPSCVQANRPPRARPAHRAHRDRSPLRRRCRPSRGTWRDSWGSKPGRFIRAVSSCCRRLSCSMAVSSRPRNCADGFSRSSANWSGRPVPELESSDLDLAVADGAAYYGQVRRGRGIRIRGGVSRSYYVGLETAAPAVPGVQPPIKALCVVPMGMEEGTETDVPGPEIGLIIGEPAQFRFLGSTVRREDSPGTILDRWNSDELEELAPLETALEAADLRPASRCPCGCTRA